MRLSSVILQFLGSSYLLIFCAFLGSIFLLWQSQKISRLGNVFETKVTEFKYLRWIFFSSAAVFLLWGYLFKSAFYTPYNTGTQGDNFNLVGAAINSPSCHFARHLIFPWIAGQSIMLASKNGLLHVQDHLYRFYAFEMASLPVRIASIIGLIYIFRLFKLLRFSVLKQWISALFLATSFGFWLWAIQPNALGMGMAFECIAIYYSAKLILEGNKASSFLAAFFIIACIYAHISAFYFSCVLSLIILIHAAWQVYKKRDGAKFNFFILLASFAVASAIFLYITMGAFEMKSFDIRAYIRNMADPSYQLPPDLPALKLLVLGITNNLALTIMNMFGFWGPQKKFDYLLIFIVLLIIFAICAYLMVNLRKLKGLFKAEGKKEGWFIWMLILIIAVPFMVFVFFKNGSHYYVITLVPTTVLFLFVVYRIDELLQRNFASFLVACIIPVSLLLNGFSSMNVLKGLDFKQSSAYKEFDALYRKFPGQKIYFFETFDEFQQPYRLVSGRKVYFFEVPLTTDYSMGAFLHCFGPSFPNIKWIYSYKPQDLLEKIQENVGTVIIGSLAYSAFSRQIPPEISVFPFKDDYYGQLFYILKNKEGKDTREAK